MEYVLPESTVGLMQLLLIVLSSSAVNGIIISQGTTKEICSKEEFTARCNYDEILMITKAQYGHIHIGRCAPRDIGLFGCAADVYQLIDNRCTSKRSCSVSPLDQDLINAEPECAAGLVTFLETSHVCIKGSMVSDVCGELMASHIENFFLTTQANNAACSAGNDYVTIQSKQGQQIEVNVLDVVSNFTTPLSIKVIDQGVEHHFEIVHQERKLAQYKSTSSEVTVVLEGLEHNYIVTYKAIGCLDLQIPTSAIAERADDLLTVKCQHTSQSWNLKCIGTRWIGSIGSCTPTTVRTPVAEVPDYIEVDNNYKDVDNSRFSKNIVIGIIVAATILLCFSVVGIGCLCAKSMKKKYLASSKDYEKCELVAVDGTIARMIRSPDGNNSWQNTLSSQHPTMMRNDRDPMIAMNTDFITINTNNL